MTFSYMWKNPKELLKNYQNKESLTWPQDKAQYTKIAFLFSCKNLKMKLTIAFKIVPQRMLQNYFLKEVQDLSYVTKHWSEEMI